MRKMNNVKGFTLIEIIIVMIIVGVLATLGLTQYTRIIEKSRGAEAKEIMGSIRKLAAGHHMQYGNLNLAPAFDNTRAGIAAGGIPGPAGTDCAGTHYFSYQILAVTTDSVTSRATRCAGSGKNPQGDANCYLQLLSDFSATTGSDTWTPGGSCAYN
jgi:prepilin-type N-terminal cleavage/methylation domain-containing protein